MRVAHIVEAFTGGLVTYMRTVLPGLVDAGLDVTLICSLNRRWPDLEREVEELEHYGVKVHVVSMVRKPNLVHDFLAFLVLKRLLNRGNFDIVHTHCSKAGVLGRIAARMAGVPVIFHTPHCFAFLRCVGWLRKSVYFVCERVLGAITTLLVGVSQDEADVAISRHIVSPSRCTYVDNALNDLLAPNCQVSAEQRRRIKASFGVADDAPVISMVGRIVPDKGVLRFSRAAEISKAEDAVFLIAGEGDMSDTIQDFIDKHELHNRLKLLGHVATVEDLYSISDLVVVCSDAEGQSYALLEAMRSGCAVIASSVPGNISTINHDVNGYLISNNSEAIAVAVDRLLYDLPARTRYARNARKCFLEHHLPSIQIAKLVFLYSSYACNHRQSGVE